VPARGRLPLVVLRLDGQPPGRADAPLAARIRQVHAADATYGAPRVTAELNDGAPAAQRVNHKRVTRVMREHHLAAVRLRRWVRTTIPEPSNHVVHDLLERDFTAEVPNTKYIGDITYLPCGAGRFLYLATVIDCFSRRLVGWSIADHMRTDLVADALRAAARERGSLTGAIFHTDHGGQYTSKDFAVLCEQLGVIRSMGKVGSCRQRDGRVVQRLAQARDPARRPRVGRRPPGPPGRVRLDHPLQHPAPTLHLRLPGPHHLREHHGQRYPAEGRITHRVPTTRSQAPSSSRKWAKA
jgi:transposase InsO family protein